MMETQYLPQVVIINEDGVVAEKEREIPKNLKEKVEILDMNFVEDKDYAEYLPSTAWKGDICLKSPFEDKYILMNEFEETLKLDKIDFICCILQQLGATKVTYTTKRTESEIVTWDAKGKLTVKPKGKGEIDVKGSNSNTDEGSLSQEIVYSGLNSNSVDQSVLQECWELAKQKAKDFNLENDSFVRFVLESRNPKNKNVQLSFSRTTELTSECNSTLNIVGRLSAVKLFSVSGEFERIVNVRNHSITTFKVEF